MLIEGKRTSNDHVIANTFSNNLSYIGETLAKQIKINTSPLQYTKCNPIVFTIPKVTIDKTGAPNFGKTWGIICFN